MMLFVKSAYSAAVSFSFKRVPSVLRVRASIRRVQRWHALALALAACCILFATVLFQIDLDLTIGAIGIVALTILAVFSCVIIMLAHAYQHHR